MIIIRLTLEELTEENRKNASSLHFDYSSNNFEPVALHDLMIPTKQLFISWANMIRSIVRELITWPSQCYQT